MSSLLPPQVSLLDQGLLQASSMALLAAEEALKEMEDEVRDKCSDMNPALIIADTAAPTKEELHKISEARNEYRKGVRKLLKDFASEITSQQKLQWESNMEGVVNLVNQHKRDVMAKVNQLAPPATPMSTYEQAMIDIQMQQLALNQQEITRKGNDAIAVAQPLKTMVIDKCSELNLELYQISVGDLVTGDDQLVSRTMLKLSGWKSSMLAISSSYQEFLTKTAVHKLSDAEHTAVTSAVDRTKTLLADIVAIAEDQDLKRHLFSLETSSRGEQVKWPIFSGEPGEDFFKFKKDFLDAAVQNKTSTKNQVTKLKENIRGYAKSLVPSSINNITRALEILEHACGDSMRVVMHRVDKLLSAGPWPPEGSRDCYTKQVKWLVRVQTYLQDIVDLANTDCELADIVYNREKLAQILKLFPTFIVDKLVRIPGYKEDKYNQIIKKLDEFKETSQQRELIYGSGGSSVQQKEKPVAA